VSKAWKTLPAHHFSLAWCIHYFVISNYTRYSQILEFCVARFQIMKLIGMVGV
jgi:hypothetical protein